MAHTPPAAHRPGGSPARPGRPRAASRRELPRAAGFTLVELMVVIAIIGILVALVTAAAVGAITAAKVARISFELTQMAQTLEAYRGEMGSYPPDFVGASSKLPPSHPRNTGNMILAHIRGHYRSISPAEQQRLFSDEFAGLDPAEALVFWLRGFSKNQLQPITGGQANAASMEDRKGAGFGFAKERLKDLDQDGWPEYYPQGSNRPYVYIRSSSYQVAFANQVIVPSGPSGPSQVGARIRPYLTKTTTSPQKDDFVEPDKYQIISAGLDHEYGTGGQFPDGIGYSKADRDNITNFSQGSTLENAMP